MTQPAPPAAGPDVVRQPGRPGDEDVEERVMAAPLALVDGGDPVIPNRIAPGNGVSRAAIH